MLHLRVMDIDDLPLGCRLSEAAGWNQLLPDWQRLLALEPAGCFVAEWDGQPVGTTCVTRFDGIAWISMVLVDAAYRGRGIGTQLMRHAIAWLDQCGVRTVRLDATTLGRPVYEKLGFTGEYEVARWEGLAAEVDGSRADSSSPTDQVRLMRSLQPTRESPETMLAADSHLEEITALDYQGDRRRAGRFLARLIAERPEGMRVAVTQGRITGLTRPLRLGGRARQIGPVIAEDASSASALLDAMLSDHLGETVFVDVPLPNRPATQWAEARGLSIQRQFLRMVRGQPVVDRPAEIWASFGPEKG